MRQFSSMRKRRFPILEKIHDYVDAGDGGQGKGKLNPDHGSAIPNASWYPTMDTYGHYRAMVFAASLPDEPQISKSSPVADHPFSAGYSDWDQQIIDKAAKLCGFSPSKLADRYSKEPDGVHVHSPVNHNSGKSIYENRISDEPYIEEHSKLDGTVIVIDMFEVPMHLRNQGIGTKFYREWESNLSKSVKRVELFAADTAGEGNTDDFWRSLGFSYKFDPTFGEPLDYEQEHTMWKGVNGNPTPPQR